jgi:hypothetical protein
VLLKLAATLAGDDFLCSRALAEHANAPAEILAQLASHPYHAVRENVARHPARLLRRWSGSRRMRTSRSGFWSPATRRPPNSRALPHAFDRRNSVTGHSPNPLVPRVDWLVSTLD